MNYSSYLKKLMIILSGFFCLFNPNGVIGESEGATYQQPEKVVRLSSSQLKSRLSKCVPPRLIGAKGFVDVELIIDKDGKVKKTQAVNGHPLARKIATDAVKQWEFKPFEVKGKTFAMSGKIRVQLSSEEREAQEQCLNHNKQS